MSRQLNKDDLIQVACTACIRPELLEITFSSFNQGLLTQFKRKELFINIDPISNQTSSIEDILAICDKYFDKVKFHQPPSGDFSKAVRWVWEQVNAEYFLHLEDDWMLNKKISKNGLIASLMSKDNIASVRLNRQTSIKNKVLDKVSLNPTLFKTSFIKESLKFYNDKLDPEKQFLCQPLKDLSDSYIHLAYGDMKNNYIEGAFVTDIGKYWRKSNGIAKIFENQKFFWGKSKYSALDSFKSWVFFKTLKLRKTINKFR